MSEQPNDKSAFLDAAKQHKPGLVADFVGFMRENTKWWLIPFLVVFGLIGALLIVAAVAPGAAPFIYALF
jgi:uncharacterized protein DUF5989